MTEIEDIEFEMVEQINEEIFAEHNFFYVEILEDNYHYADIIGFSLVNEKGHFFISTEKHWIIRFLKHGQKMRIERKRFMMQNEPSCLATSWYSFKRGDFDLLIASYLANPSETIDDVTAVAKRYDFNAIQSDDVFYGKGAKRRIPDEEELAEHLVRKAPFLMI